MGARAQKGVGSRNLGHYSGSSLHGIVDSRARRTFEILRDQIHADTDKLTDIRQCILGRYVN